MTTTNDISTRPVNFIRFHGLTLLVVENQGVEYIDPRPLCELAGMVWKSARRTLLSGDNVELYGSRVLQHPSFTSFGTNLVPEKDGLYIRLDRSRMFIARVNTSHMRAVGKVSAATALLALQIEWAEALHAYETHGVALKKGQREARAELVGLMKVRELARPSEQAAFDLLVREAMTELGCVLPFDAQKQLDLA